MELWSKNSAASRPHLPRLAAPSIHSYSVQVGFQSCDGIMHTHLAEYALAHKNRSFMAMAKAIMSVRQRLGSLFFSRFPSPPLPFQTVFFSLTPFPHFFSSSFVVVADKGRKPSLLRSSLVSLAEFETNSSRA